MTPNVISDVIDTQQQLNPKDVTDLVFKLFNDQLPEEHQTVRLVGQNIGHAFYLGHAKNGMLGTANGEDGSQILLGTGGLGTSTISRVMSNDNHFYEPLRDNSYVDTTLTTATVDTTTYKITF